MSTISSPHRFIDSHIHLWPHNAASPTSHSWMRPGHSLTRQFSIDDYIASNKSDPALSGFVYVETDRRLLAFDALDQDFRWACETLDEIRWLTRMVEGSPGKGEGFVKENSDLLKGAVIWAPADQGIQVFQRYVALVKEIAGDETWKKVKGFRFLLQGIADEKRFKCLVSSKAFEDVLEEMGNMGMSFDVGVDSHSVGLWQAEATVEAIENLRRRESQKTKPTVFILNHMCKPDYSHSPPMSEKEIEDLARWSKCISRLAKDEHVYMKLSGGFTEMEEQSPSEPWSTSKYVEIMKPWVDHLFKAFRPQRIMFGSDWPVCNVGGLGTELAWSSWKAIVAAITDEHMLSDEQKDAIWYKTAAEAYQLS